MKVFLHKSFAVSGNGVYERSYGVRNPFGILKDQSIR